MSSSTFDFDSLRRELGAQSCHFDVEHLEECSSTNTLLLARAAQSAPSGLVLVADRQSAGRGRRGRVWHSSPNFSLTFSVLWRLNSLHLAGLSLAVGVAIAQALEKLGVKGLGLKWPNDIQLFGKKLGGVLIESIFSPSTLVVVIGIGLNLRADPAWRLINQPFASLHESVEGLTREQVLARILVELEQVLREFSLQGFAPLRAAWTRLHAFENLPVCVQADAHQQIGVCRGVNDQGELRLEGIDGIVSILHGDVSLRPLE